MRKYVKGLPEYNNYDTICITYESLRLFRALDVDRFSYLGFIPLKKVITLSRATSVYGIAI